MTVFRSIPQKDHEFDERQKVVVETAQVNIDEWKIDVPWFNERVLPAKLVWETAWNEYRNPTTRSIYLTFNKNEARKSYEPLLRKLVGYLKANILIPPAKLVEMGLIPSAQENGAHNPAPLAYPAFSVDSSVIRRLTIHLLNSETHTRAKPRGVHGAEIRSAMMETVPKDISELTMSSFVTRSKVTFEYSESERGKTVMFCTRWENTTGESGPWSEIVSAKIP